MRRVLAFLLGTALAFTGQASALHTHVYTNHDHPEHHHGPAAHDHHAVETHSVDHPVSLEACDPGRHAVSVALGFAAVTHPPTVAAEGGTAAILDPLIRSHEATAITDVRVHGPPPRTQAAPRAPPLTLHA